MIQFAFSAAACPQWDMETLAARARELKYDGVELCPGSGSAGDPMLTDPRKAREIFQSAGVRAAALAGTVIFTQNKKTDAEAADQVRRWIELAGEVECGLVKILDVRLKPRQSRSAAGLALGDWLAPLADAAKERGVVLGVENAITFRTARELWMVLERLNHPSIGAAWNVNSAAEAGESPWTSVPTLNSRIVYATARQGGQGAPVDLRDFLERLRGIGYGGWVTIHTAPEQLAETIARLKPGD